MIIELKNKKQAKLFLKNNIPLYLGEETYNDIEWDETPTLDYSIGDVEGDFTKYRVGVDRKYLKKIIQLFYNLPEIKL